MATEGPTPLKETLTLKKEFFDKQLQDHYPRALITRGNSFMRMAKRSLQMAILGKVQSAILSMRCQGKPIVSTYEKLIYLIMTRLFTQWWNAFRLLTKCFSQKAIFRETSLKIAFCEKHFVRSL